MNRITATLSALALVFGLMLAAPAADAAGTTHHESHCQTKDPDGIWGKSLTACETYSYRALSGRRIQGTALVVHGNCYTSGDQFTHIHVKITTTSHVNRYPWYSDCHGHPSAHFHMTVPGNRARVDVWMKGERVGDTDAWFHLVFHVCRDGRC